MGLRSLEHQQCTKTNTKINRPRLVLGDWFDETETVQIHST